MRKPRLSQSAYITQCREIAFKYVWQPPDQKKPLKQFLQEAGYSEKTAGLRLSQLKVLMPHLYIAILEERQAQRHRIAGTIPVDKQEVHNEALLAMVEKMHAAEGDRDMIAAGKAVLDATKADSPLVGININMAEIPHDFREDIIELTRLRQLAQGRQIETTKDTAPAALPDMTKG